MAVREEDAEPLANRDFGPSAPEAETEMRPRPAFSGGMPRRRLRRRRWPFLSVTSRILLLNSVALGMLVGGVLYLNQFRSGLIDMRVRALLTQGEIIANAIGESATTGPEATTLDPGEASTILRRLVLPTNTRARLFVPGGGVIADTRHLLGREKVRVVDLPPPGWRTTLHSWAHTFYHWTMARLFPGERLPLYREAPGPRGRHYREVRAALAGQKVSAVRTNSEDELIVSIAVPVQRFKVVLGALMLATEAGDIDQIVRAERMAILQVFLVALSVTTLLSLVLARTIARPLRRLAAAAERVRSGHGAGRAMIPGLSGRGDEIGELAAVLREMTEALYARMDAIESFAADVSHELKNPLTSVRSAVESLSRTRDPRHQERLLAIIADDVRRLDRLLTDISNASRLDSELSRAEAVPVDLATLMETMVDIYRVTAEGSGKAIRFSFTRDDGGVGDRAFLVHGLESRLGQVVRNLLDNAVSFSPPGGDIMLRAVRAGRDVLLIVEDEGPGIPEESMEAIFRRFYSERPSSEPFGTHSGLGLNISKQIVEAHDGSIIAENRRAPGGGRVRGARFIVRLPVR
jgi:two-component system sensor histidine kinase ChvG